MFGWTGNSKSRRQQLRKKRAQAAGATRIRLGQRLFTWPVAASLAFVLGASAIALMGASTLEYSIGQQLDHPIYARVDFQIPDPQQTKSNRQAARASTPSYYIRNAPGVTVDRIRADLRKLYELGVTAETFEAYQKAIQRFEWPIDRAAHDRLRSLGELPEDQGRASFLQRVDALPLEGEYVVRDLLHEPRSPASNADFVMLELPDKSDALTRIPRANMVRQENTRALQGSAAELSKTFHPSLRPTVEAIVLATFRLRPTLVFDSEATFEEMRRAEERTPEAMATYERGRPFVTPGVVTFEQVNLLRAEHESYLRFLRADLADTPELAGDRTLQDSLRKSHFLKRLGLMVLVALFSTALMIYAKSNRPRLFEVRRRTMAFLALMLGMLVIARLLEMTWPTWPEFTLVPCVLCGGILAVIFPQRFAVGTICVGVVVVSLVVGGDLSLLATLFVGVAVTGFQLDEIRTRTKLISSGAVTALAVFVVLFATGLTRADSLGFVARHAALGAACALLASFLLSGLLPFVERTFRIATSLTLLEWRDPTRPLLQLLAQEAPGTYNHSLVLGTLGEAACERIGANGLLAQVGALYHDIGKIPKAEYFAENQHGQINRHDNLAPTMSLLIIVGHVKDGVEMAKEYKIPRVLHQFIAEHHGTSVVRYFHHVASEKQPQIASGKHDREVAEAEFRYGGPKPKSRESAVIMLCDGVEGAVRALPEPTVGRIESVVHQIVGDRLGDGQLSECDLTMRDVRQVEDSLVKSLSSIYHGRVAYPKGRKPADERSEPVPGRVNAGA